MAYLDVEGFKARTFMPADEVDEVGSTFVLSRLAVASSEIDSRLRKRYAVPFTSPVPEVVLGWVVAIVTPDLYLRRGWDPSTDQAQSITAAAALAREQMKEAADAKDGLFDLPLRDDNVASAISRGGPLVYSEASAYDHLDVQREALRGR